MSSNAELFHFVMIKPSHYDDDGYPIQWLRSAIPSNALASCLPLPTTRGGASARSWCRLRLHTYDETNRRVRPDQIMRMIRKEGGRALIGLVGVQSNQFPRAVDLARRFIAGGLPVCIGGFHVSGCISMLPEMPPEMVEAQALGISLFAGEAEEQRLDQVLQDAWHGKLKPLYNHMKDLPTLAGEPAPILPASMCGAPRGRYRASIWAAAAPINVPSARSSMCRDEKAGFARWTISNGSCAKT